MRHEFASRPVSARTLGMRETSPAAGLVTGARRALTASAGMRAAISSAVNLAAIATTANQRLGPTPGAQKKPGRSSFALIGLADAMWTSARLSAILIGHVRPSPCGARRRAEPASRDRRRACLREGQAYPNDAGTSGRTTRRPINLSHAPSRDSAAKKISCQVHNSAIYPRIFTAIDNGDIMGRAIIKPIDIAPAVSVSWV
jgi:hypothetical protein